MMGTTRFSLLTYSYLPCACEMPSDLVPRLPVGYEVRNVLTTPRRCMKYENLYSYYGRPSRTVYEKTTDTTVVATKGTTHTYHGEDGNCFDVAAGLRRRRRVIRDSNGTYQTCGEQNDTFDAKNTRVITRDNSASSSADDGSWSMLLFISDVPRRAAAAAPTRRDGTTRIRNRRTTTHGGGPR